MDTVSMLNKMSFYCQPILPLVYDESMSYYETLCKVVGQLNTTGETVNKLNEGLTSEIADRQAADAALDERLKLIEATNAKIHFLVFDGANPNGGFPTRSELYQWVHEGDAIFTLFRTYEEGRGQIYAASCSYNSGNWGSEASNDFSIIVPLETSYDAAQDYAVRQKVAKISIPLSPQTNLNVAWRLQIIEINTPYTSADGVVNLVAVINDSDSVNCSITPSEFFGLYNMTRGGKNLCVAVNAKLAYDGLARSSSVATVDTTNRKIRIAFERDYGTFINNGVKQLNKTLDYIIGDASTNVWTHETIDSKTLDFSRYEGFQFTRGENNVITANDESTPNAVYAQYHSDTSGKLYQNLPVRLVDTVDNAEYWNGVFDIKDDRHMTFTFVTSNYVTASGKMLVRVIELSADVNTTTWKYAAKEFTLPLTGGSSDFVINATLDSDTQCTLDKTFGQIREAVREGKNPVVHLPDPSSTGTVIMPLTEDNSLIFIFRTTIGIDFGNDSAIGQYIISINKDNKASLIMMSGVALNSDGNLTQQTMDRAPVTDMQIATKKYVDEGLDKKAGKEVASASANGLMSKDDKAKLDGVEAGANKTTVDAALDAASENPVQNKAVKAALDGKLDKTGGTLTGNLRVTGALFSGDGLSFGTGENIHFTKAADDAGKLAHGAAGVDDTVPLARLKVASPTDDDDAATKAYVDNNAAGAGAVRYDAAQTLDFAQQGQARTNIGAIGHNSPQFQGFLALAPANETLGSGVGLSPTGSGHNYTLNISDVDEGNPTLLTGVKTPTDADTNAAATVEYVKNKVTGAPIIIKLGTGSAATSTATFAEIKAALEAGKAPILDSATGTSHWFALNWTLSGSGSLSIQYGTFNVEGGGAANFTFYDVAVSSTGITYSSRQFTSQ